MGCGLPTLFSITDITNSQDEPHFKATRWVIGELSEVNTANCLAFPPQIQDLLTNTIRPQKKKMTLNYRVWVNKINNNILLLNKRKKETKKKSGKSQERENLSSKWWKVKLRFDNGRYSPLSYKFNG